MDVCARISVECVCMCVREYVSECIYVLCLRVMCLAVCARMRAWRTWKENITLKVKRTL